MAEDYYIRASDEETARGPYNIDQLVTLAEAGKVNRDHLYFDKEMGAWVTVSSNDILLEKIFPAKKRLSLRRPEESTESSEPDDPEGAVRVTDMLAAAEGYTKETEYIREAARWRERTANLTVPVIGVMLLLSAATIIYPSWTIIQDLLNDPEASYALLLGSPLVLLGLADAVMGLLILLNATELFPVVRFRAMLGSGYFATLHAAHFLNGDTQAVWLAIAMLLFGVGLFICTLTLNFRMMVASAVLGFAGVLGLAWFQNIQPLIAGN